MSASGPGASAPALAVSVVWGYGLRPDPNRRYREEPDLPFAHGVGPLEWIIILVIVVIVFGVGKLPSVGGALGRGIREFREEAKTEHDQQEADKSSPKGQSTMKSESKAESAADAGAAKGESSEKVG